MSNNGSLGIINSGWNNMKVVEFGNFYRLFFDGSNIDVTLTFKREDPSIV